MNKNPHEFDHLNAWNSLSDADINGVVSTGTIAILQKVVHLLSESPPHEQPCVDSDNFVALVRKMGELYKRGSRTLGEAIIAASELLDTNQMEEAKAVYKQFLSSCSSKFYRDIASRQLKKISTK